MSRPEWLIEGILPANAISLIAGATSSGKTFWALDWAFSIAVGQEWHGNAIKEGAVIYVAAEGAEGITQRLAAWEQHHNRSLDDAPFHRIDEPINLFNDPAQVDELIEYINEEFPGTQLIVFDTLARYMEGIEENDNGQMNLVVARADRIRRETGAAVLLVHHTSNEKSKLPRGATALRAGVSMSALVTKRESTTTLQCNKQKNAQEFGAVTLRLKEIKIGEGETSLVLLADGEASEETAPQANGRATRRNHEQPTNPKRTRFARELVITTIVNAGHPVDWHDLVRLLGMQPSTARQWISRLASEKDGVLTEVGGGKYGLARAAA